MQGTYVAFLRRWLWLLALGIIIGIGAGLLFRAAQPLNTLDMWPPLHHVAEFHSKATVQMLPNSVLLASGLVSQQDLNTLGQSLASEAKTQSVLEAVSADMPADLNLSADELAAMIEATPLTSSTGVELTVTSYDRAQPGLIAEKAAYHLSQQIASEQEAKLKLQISQLDRTLEALKSQMDAAESQQGQDSGGNVTDRVSENATVLRELYRDLYREYISLSLGLPSGVGGGSTNDTQTMNELAQALEDLRAQIDKADAAQQQASGGAVNTAENIETAVQRQLYSDSYRQYINLSIKLPITIDELFMPTEITPVHEVSPDRISIRNVVVLGGLGGLVLAWFLAGVIDYVRRRKRVEEDTST
jgi:hypothetical protein